MTRPIRILTVLAAVVAGFALPLRAQADAAHGTAPHGETAQAVGAAAAAQATEQVDIITPHITDSHELELPGPPPTFVTHVHLPRWAPVNVPGIGAVDFSPTKHVVFMLVAALTAAVVLIGVARAHAKHSHRAGAPKGFAAGMEGMILYLRNEVILPNVGHHGNGFVPFLLTLFFFILLCNLWGIVPWGATATGNIAVTATLAIITFFVVEAAGIRANGLGYLNTIFYWNTDLPLPMRILMFIILTPIEIVGKLTKPFALMIRLFANMTAGHIVVLALIGMIFAFKSIASGAPFIMAVLINVLELFVAFLQAFIFTLLSSVFIGQIREAHH
ncbi:MAG: F0F1 ATP synthase subunit A [Gemmatimonadaceae bacterium]|jgi:F-type H+-transporting ATPase subunit a|nr:F0F1 ATP synthase subunit A [Gemmatimonadaceae bacterium]